MASQAKLFLRRTTASTSTIPVVMVCAVAALLTHKPRQALRAGIAS